MRAIRRSYSTPLYVRIVNPAVYAGKCTVNKVHWYVSFADQP